MMSESTTYDDLMPKILALIDPAETQLNKDNSLIDQHPFFRRKGKWHNHDYCDACGEKGKLLCCDICPASFHLLCHDPPLEVVNVPNGPWTCFACTNIMDTENDPSKKSYKIEFNNNKKSSNYETGSGSKYRNINFVSRQDAPPYGSNILKCLLSDELSVGEKKESISVELNQTDCDISVKNQQKLPEFKHNSLLNCNETCSPSKQENGNILTLKKTKNCQSTQNIHDIEIEGKTREMNEPKDDKLAHVLNSGRIRSKNRKNSNCDTKSERSRLTPSDGLKSGKKIRCLDFEISLSNCNSVLEKSPVPYNNLENCRGENSALSIENAITISEIENIFKVIISETKKLNPRQFILPKEYTASIDENLLKLDKDCDNLFCDWDSNDLLKIPPRKCYVCKGICLSGPIISCDFCPAHFHLNCLNPPLCSIPEEKWMCPLHPHHILNKIMNNPDSITELSTWWRNFSASIDSDDIISKFIKKAERSRKVSKLSKNTSVKIPDIVKYHYKNPVIRIPSLDDLTHFKDNCLFEENFTLIPHEFISKSNNCCSRSMNRNKTFDSGDNKISSSSNKAVETSEIDESSLIEITSNDGPENLFTNFSENSCRKNENLSTWDGQKNNFRFKSSGIYNFDSVPEIKSTTNTNNKKRPWEKIEEILSENINTKFITNGTCSTKLNSGLNRLLLNETINSIIRDFPPSFLPKTTPYPFTPPFWTNDSLTDKLSFQVRAVLCPLSHRAPPVYMYTGTLNIGTDFSNDLCLLNYGHCNFVSPEHAVIFHDKLNNTYELLNYSEFYTMVDGIMHTCDISSSTEAEKTDPGLSVRNSSFIEKKPKVSNFSSEKTAEISSKKQKKAGVPFLASKSRTKYSSSESRNSFKKLITDIDKLVTKSKKEMASIAEEDLNEIAKAVKASSESLKIGKESFTDKHKSKKKTDFVVHLKPLENEASIQDNIELDSSSKSMFKFYPKFSSTSDDSESFGRLNEQQLEPSVFADVAPNVPALKVPKLKRSIGEDDSPSLRRSQRKIKRSIFSTHRREMRKDGKFSMRRINGDSEDEVEIINKEDSPVTIEDEKSIKEESNPSNDSKQVPEMKEKCRCQLNNLKLPRGNDASWENSALLQHGSYIRFGCIEFVFSIIDYSSDSKDNSPKTLHSPSCKSDQIDSPPLKREKNDDDSLSTKLKSILNVLSIKTTSVSKSNNSSSDNSSSKVSPESSRSPSPLLSPATALDKPIPGLFEVSYDDCKPIRFEVETKIPIEAYRK